MMLTNGWKKVKLGDVIKSLDAGVSVNSVDEPASKNSIGVLKTSCVSSGSFNPNENKAVVSADIDRVSVSVKADRIILSRMNSPSLVGANAYISSDFSNLYLPDRLWQLEPYPNKVNMRWLSYVLGRQETKNRFLNMATGTSNSMKNITKEDVLNLDISLPPIEEQKKIAATLSVWDSAIEKMGKLIEAKESQKKSLITKLIVFSDDKNISELTKIKLSDIFDEMCEKNRPDEDVLTIIQGVGTVLRTDSGREIIYDKNSLSNYKYVKKGDFIIHLRSFESGLEVANQDGIVSPAYIILRPKIKVSTVYLYSLFHTNEFINRTIAPAVEGARDGRSVKYDVLKNQTITLPNLSEQQSVARLLLKADEELSLLKQQLENYKKQKQGLMQKLLTGQWRVK